MHFAVLVVTKDKPTEDVLAAALAPFKDSKWDWWTLGGRYTGQLIPHDVADTVTGGHDLPEIEVMVDAMFKKDGMVIQRPGSTGPGVDALQLGNFKQGQAGFAVVIDGRWHECEVMPIEPIVRAYGLDRCTVGSRDYTEERAAVKRWDARLTALMDGAPDDHWVSVVDIHN